jgi:hypothetical protein
VRSHGKQCKKQRRFVPALDRFGARGAIIALVLLALIGVPDLCSAGLESTEVLPTHVHSPALRAGTIAGIGERYDSQGQLLSLSDVHSIEFNVRELAKIEPRVNELVRALNQFGNQSLGSSLYLGALRVNSTPEVRYLAPLHAYGVTPHWTVAVGLPIVQYKNRLSLEQSGGNIAQIRAQVGQASPEINDAFNRLNVSLVGSAQKELQSKGYKPIADRDQTMIGDAQLVSLYQFYKSADWGGVFRTAITVPTGPSADPDDLADLGLFGETAVEPSVTTSKSFSGPSRFAVAARVGLHLPLPDHVVKRVPLNEDDTLPGAETKRSVARQLGPALMAGLSGSMNLTSRWSSGLGYDFVTKAADRFRESSGGGSRASGDVHLLERETNSVAHRVRAVLSYSSTEAYFAQKALLPAIFSYEISDTIRGFNIQRETIQELWLTLFF